MIGYVAGGYVNTGQTRDGQTILSLDIQTIFSILPIAVAAVFTSHIVYDSLLIMYFSAGEDTSRGVLNNQYFFRTCSKNASTCLRIAVVFPRWLLIKTENKRSLLLVVYK